MLCFALFSVSSTALASTDDVASTIDNLQYIVFTRNTSSGSYGTTLLNYTVKAGSWGIQNNLDLLPYRWSDTYICENFIYSKGTNNLIASKGSSVKFELTGIYNLLICEYGSSSYESNLNPSNISSINLILKDKAGNSFYYNTLPISSFSNTSITGTTLDCVGFEVDELTSDLYSIDIEVRFIANNVFTNIPTDAWNGASSYRLLTGFGDKTMLQVFVEDGSKGLLKGIINIVTNIKDGVSNLISGITELPSKLWNLIENGLKGLFVPTESQMTDIKVQWDNLLSDRFGGLYQTVQLIDDYAGTFKEPSQSQSSIDFPEFRLNVGSDSEFVLQAHDVQIVPERFSFLVDVVKTIISIIATCLFVNGLRNKFERLVGGHE